MRLIKGRDAIFEVDKYDVVLVGTSTHQTLDGGFQGKLRNKYPVIEKINNQTRYGDLRKLGTRVTVNSTKPVISLMYICTYPTSKPFIDYLALEKCLQTANAQFKGKKVITTLLGSSRFDGKGERNKCIDIIKKTTKDICLDVFDYDQKTLREEKTSQHKFFMNLLEENKDNPSVCEQIRKMEKEMLFKTFILKNE